MQWKKLGSLRVSAATADISYQEWDKPPHTWLGLGDAGMTSSAYESPNKWKSSAKMYHS